MALSTVNAIWIGSKLGPLHAACLRSFVRHGHRTVLYVYEAPEDTPRGVELADAKELLPLDPTITDLRIQSDLMRYELLAQDRGLYVDCDIFCVRPIEDAEYLFGEGVDSHLNNGLIKLPADCPALRDLRRVGGRNYVPPWLSHGAKFKRRFSAIMGRTLDQDSTGPKALTYYIKKHRLMRHARPSDVFHPLPHRRVSLLFDPDLRLDDLITRRTATIHLFGSAIQKSRLKVLEAPTQSPLGQILAS